MSSSNWTLRSISSLCHRVTSGGTPLRSNRSFYENGTIPWIKTGELKGWYIETAEEHITEEAIHKSSAKLFPPETILMAMYGQGNTITNVGILRIEAATNQACCAMIPDTTQCHPHFLLYALKFYKDHLLNLATGASQRNLSVTKIANFHLLVPSPPLQHRIAAILAAYDELIENNLRRINLLEQAARDLYQEWFVHYRFPGHEQIEMVESESGRIPNGWTVDSVQAVADVNALSLRNSHEMNTIRYVDISSVSTGKIEEIRELPYSDAPGRARRIIRHGDTIWSMVRPNRQSYALILHPEDNLIVSTGFAVVSPTKLPFTYVYHALTTDAFVGYLVNHARGAAYPAVTGEDFENARIVHPAEVIAEKFHYNVLPMYEQRETLIRKNALLSQSRDLLLPRLVSGELDVTQVSAGGIE
jgi:type I restriction enzyme S subunit